jgi:hypothetical protein
MQWKYKNDVSNEITLLREGKRSSRVWSERIYSPKKLFVGNGIASLTHRVASLTKQFPHPIRFRE